MTEIATNPAPLRVAYRNWRGVIAARTIAPIGLRFGTSQWHPKPQWLLLARDLERDEEREFALADMAPMPPGAHCAGCVLAQRDGRPACDAC